MKKLTPFVLIVFILLAVVTPLSAVLAQDPVPPARETPPPPLPPVPIDPPIWRLEGLEWSDPKKVDTKLG